MISTSADEEGLPRKVLPMTPEMDLAVNLFRVVLTLLLLVNIGFFVWDLRAACDRSSRGCMSKRKRSEIANRVFFMRTLVFLHVCATILCYSFGMVYAWNVPFPYSPVMCRVVTTVSPIMYGMAVQLVLYVMVVRCNFVDGLITTRTYRWVSLFARIYYSLFVPTLMLITPPLTVHGFINPYGVCEQVKDSPMFIDVTYIVGVSAITTMMMYLFVAPIRVSIAVVNPANKRSLQATLYRNVVLSSIAMLSEIICPALYIAMNRKTGSDWETSTTFIYSNIPPSIDLTILGICARLMVVDSDLCFPCIPRVKKPVVQDTEHEPPQESQSKVLQDQTTWTRPTTVSVSHAVMVA